MGGGGGGEFLDFMGGGHSCYEGGHRAHGDPPVPPLEKTLALKMSKLLCLQTFFSLMSNNAVSYMLDSAVRQAIRYRDCISSPLFALKFEIPSEVGDKNAKFSIKNLLVLLNFGMRNILLHLSVSSLSS